MVAPDTRNRIRTGLLLLVGTVALSCVAAPAWAQPAPYGYGYGYAPAPARPGSLSFGVRLSTTSWRDGPSNAIGGQFTPRLWGIGLQARHMLSARWSLEVAVDFMSGSQTSGAQIGVGDGSGLVFDDRLHRGAIPLTLSLIGHPLGHTPIDPYVLAGIGTQWNWWTLEDSVFESTNVELLGQVGAGVQFWLGRHLAIHVDGRLIGAVGGASGTNTVCPNMACEGTDRRALPPDSNVGFQIQSGVTGYWP